jgi:hypothetical protein
VQAAVTYLGIAVLVFALSGLLSMAGLDAAFIFVPLFYRLGVLLPAASSTALLLNAISLPFASGDTCRADYEQPRTAPARWRAARRSAPLCQGVLWLVAGCRRTGTGSGGAAPGGVS